MREGGLEPPRDESHQALNLEWHALAGVGWGVHGVGHQGGVTPDVPKIMYLSDFVSRYALARDCCAAYVQDLQATVEQLSKYAGRCLRLEDLESDFVNGWLASLKGRFSPRTIRNKRVNLCVLWRAAFNERLIEKPPERIRAIRVPQSIPIGFLREELAALIHVADDLRSNWCDGTPRRLWFGSYFRGAYDTALRLGDMLDIEIPWIWPGGYLSIVQNKTGRTHRVQFRQETLAMIYELVGSRTTGKVWSLPVRREQFFWWFRKLRERAGLPQGTSKWIRRSSASYVAAHYGYDAASEHLGHRSRELAQEHYLDPRIAWQQRPMPPALHG
jgi:integrase